MPTLVEGGEGVTIGCCPHAEENGAEPCVLLTVAEVRDSLRGRLKPEDAETLGNALIADAASLKAATELWRAVNRNEEE